MVEIRIGFIRRANRMSPQLGVGASTKADSLATFSTMSSETGDNPRFIRSVAPGVGIISAIPNGRYAAWNGTSMAAPIAAGIAALIKSNEPSLGPEQIVNRIDDTGIPWEFVRSVSSSNPAPYPVRTSRLDALCALNNVIDCGVTEDAASRNPGKIVKK